MGIKRHKPEEIVKKLRQVEVLVGQGMPRSMRSGKSESHRKAIRTEETIDYRDLDAQPQRWQQHQSGRGLADERTAQAATVRNGWRADSNGVRCSQARC